MTLDILYYFKKALNEAVNNKNFDYLCTIENSIDSKKWFQIKYDTLNLFYPYSDDPLSKLKEMKIELSEDITIVEWQPNSFLTMEYFADNEEKSRELINTIEIYLERVLNCKDSDNWTIIEN